MVYLTTLSVVQPIWRRMTGPLMNDELKKMWNEASMAYFELLSQRTPGGYEKNHE
jgi:hypothetical protein